MTNISKFVALPASYPHNHWEVINKEDGFSVPDAKTARALANTLNALIERINELEENNYHAGIERDLNDN